MPDILVWSSFFGFALNWILLPNLALDLLPCHLDENSKLINDWIYVMFLSTITGVLEKAG